MKVYISKKLNLSLADSFKLQKTLYKKYGTTLFGLMKFHGVEPVDFLDFVHDINLDGLKKSNELRFSIDSLPGEKYIYTNGDEKWAEKILNALGIEQSINKIFDIIKSGYIPKPQKENYSKFVKEFNVDPKKSVFFEDTKKNLEYAHTIGMITIHIDEKFDFKNDDSNLESFIDFKFKCIKSALKVINHHVK